jgi:hypothetical protein
VDRIFPARLCYALLVSIWLIGEKCLRC